MNDVSHGSSSRGGTSRVAHPRHRPTAAGLVSSRPHAIRLKCQRACSSLVAEDIGLSRRASQSTWLVTRAVGSPAATGGLQISEVCSRSRTWFIPGAPELGRCALPSLQEQGQSTASRGPKRTRATMISGAPKS
jgi:hypothetical protein